MNKVIFIGNAPLNEVLIGNFCICELIENGLDVEYWDVAFLLARNNSNRHTVYQDIVSEIKNYAELKRKIDMLDCKTDKVVLQLRFEIRLYRLFRIVTSAKIKTYFFAVGILPLPTKKSNYKFILFNPVFVLKYFLNKLLFMFILKTSLIRLQNIFFTAGAIAEKSFCGYGRTVNINHIDYEKSLKTKEMIDLNNKKYIVFLDQDLPSHPDLSIGNRQGDEVAYDYYGRLDTFFCRLEQRFDADVVIAVHPKTMNAESKFFGRKVFHGSTDALVKKCEFVVAHYSTSISFAVLFLKPLVFVSEQKFILFKQDIPDIVSSFAVYLNSDVVSMDDECDNLHFSINVDAYKKYKYNFLTSPTSENKINANTILNEFLN